MAMNQIPPVDALRNLVDYDPETGKFTWRERPPSMFHGFDCNGWKPPEWIAKSWNNRFAGKEAGAARNDGYRAITIENKRFLAHRVAWVMQYGYEPTEVDHINGKRDDNRISNLREVTRTENNINAALQSNNKSGFHGVRQNPSNGKWIAEIKRDGQRVYLGHYSTVEEAGAARKGAERVLRFHRNHGRKKW